MRYRNAADKDTAKETIQEQTVSRAYGQAMKKSNQHEAANNCSFKSCGNHLKMGAPTTTVSKGEKCSHETNPVLDRQEAAPHAGRNMAKT